jgi:hypothetical protein
MKRLATTDLLQAWMVVLALCAPAARAADITVTGGSDGIAVITITGKIVIQDIETFRSRSASSPHAIVVFDSPGGAAMTGIGIGKLIRAKKYRTFVKHDTMCASACALAWLGGVQRAISARGSVGFHAMYDADTKLESGWANALVGAYLSKLGLSDNAIFYITHEGPTSMQWLRADDATKLGIDAVTISCDPERCSATPTTTNIPQYGTPGPPMERKVAAALSGYFASWSSVGDASYADRTMQIDFVLKLSKLYADQVNYNGHVISNGAVVAAKEAFMNKWPRRNYRIRRGTLSVKCIKGLDDSWSDAVWCDATGIVDYSIGSPTTTTTGAEKFNFSIVEKSPGAGLMVVGETSKVIPRYTDDRGALMRQCAEADFIGIPSAAAKGLCRLTEKPL